MVSQPPTPTGKASAGDDRQTIRRSFGSKENLDRLDRLLLSSKERTSLKSAKGQTAPVSTVGSQVRSTLNFGYGHCPSGCDGPRADRRASPLFRTMRRSGALRSDPRRFTAGEAFTDPGHIPLGERLLCLPPTPAAIKEAQSSAAKSAGRPKTFMDEVDDYAYCVQQRRDGPGFGGFWG